MSIEIKDEELKAVAAQAVKGHVISVMKSANYQLDDDIKRYIGRSLNHGDWQKSVDWAIGQGLRDAVTEAFEESGAKEKLKAQVKAYLETEEFKEEAFAKLKQLAIDSIGAA